MTPDPRTHIQVRPGAYADSVALLQVSKDVAATPGVDAVQVAMATPLNIDLIAGMGFDIPSSVTPNDMVVAVRLGADGLLNEAMAAVEAALAATGGRGEGGPEQLAPPRTTGAGLRRGDAELALVSVPGPSAFVEAMDAIDAGCDVMVFSDNVPVAQEVALKRAAERAGVLVMGPDCGTALVGGLGLGFANAVRPGPVGIVAASGTGCQQLMTLLDGADVGVTAALGVGGRDLSAAVGGLSTRQALRLLDADPATELIVVVSKPPAAEVAAALESFTAGLSTPVQLALLGPGQPDLTAAAERIVRALDRPVPGWQTWGEDARRSARGWLRGLFAGGTLCTEAMLIAEETLGPIRSNVPLSPDLRLGRGRGHGLGQGLGRDLLPDAHVMVDFGDDEMTLGRAHPMIDPTMRLKQVAAAAADPRSGVLLLDVVLGHGAQDDPAADLVPALEAVRRDLPVVIACVGTDADPQGLTRQATALAAAGAAVFASNAAAARHAVSLLTDGAPA